MAVATDTALPRTLPVAEPSIRGVPSRLAEIIINDPHTEAWKMAMIDTLLWGMWLNDLRSRTMLAHKVFNSADHWKEVTDELRRLEVVNKAGFERTMLANHWTFGKAITMLSTCGEIDGLPTVPPPPVAPPPLDRRGQALGTPNAERQNAR